MTSALEGGWWSSRPGRFYPREDQVPILQEAGWAPGPVGYELLSFVDWYRHGFWYICADVTDEYAASFVRVLCCPGDDACKFPLNVSYVARRHISEHGNFQGHRRENLTVYCREVRVWNWIYSNVTMKPVVLSVISWDYYLFQISIYEPNIKIQFSLYSLVLQVKCRYLSSY
jgi:hypothetical protein